MTALNPPYGWRDLHDSEYPDILAQTDILRSGDGVRVTAYLWVRDHGDVVDVVVEEEWTPTDIDLAEYENTAAPVIEMTVDSKDAQHAVDDAGEAWLSWARTTSDHCS
ncbi:hypothetical protein KTS45_11075 [Halomicroarcula limicola]|uniref:Uncharacterized protein n=1 Tax=Haloarcula limicola TaxID=1429915 RepID=A0A8J7YCI5_9EURY|nr:hypothetical protein [Halomicroarcula limicola]MBV0924741.1 hypothetical protein [Halomicroarcula limicola]